MKTNFLLLLIILLAVAVTLGIMKSRTSPTGMGFSPEVVAFTATPEVVNPGDPVTLAWETRGTASVALEWGPEKPSRDTVELRSGLPSSGTMTVRPKANTVYELRCYTGAGPMCVPISTTVHTK